MTAKKALRGFAKLSAEAHREISARGGRKAHAGGKAYEWTREEAQAAGRIGGLSRASKLKIVDDAL